eukprot:c26637_g1_i1.p1 GENE.c26637_g1_i1~~c26637_g1_i1.p1  ORF type:complete len:300 (+),score=60.04 c26637_g1_i1:45-944(+)
MRVLFAALLVAVSGVPTNLRTNLLGFKDLKISDIPIAAIQALRANDESEFADCLYFLLTTMSKPDLENLTVGYLFDNIDRALEARYATDWAQQVPWDIFLNDVLPYASLTEPRDPWRPLFRTKFAPLVNQTTSIGEAAILLNQLSWRIVDPPIIFVAAPPNQLNGYSPFEVMKQHNASCTGLSVFLVAALRSVGIPARVAGVPHWNLPSCSSDADPDCGNHNWVEVWVDGSWKFIDQDTTNPLNTSWFYPGHTQYQVPGTQNHSIFATSWNATSTYFPMVWDWSDHSVPAFDVTSFYLG